MSQVHGEKRFRGYGPGAGRLVEIGLATWMDELGQRACFCPVWFYDSMSTLKIADLSALIMFSTLRLGLDLWNTVRTESANLWEDVCYI